MSTTEAPVAKPRGFAAMTPEARAAATEKGNATRAANKAANGVAQVTNSAPTAPPSSVDVAALLARIAKLEADAAARAVPAGATELPGVKLLPATRGVEAIYRYKPKGGWKAVAEKGHSIIRSHEDPRWDGELMEPPYNGNVNGALEVAWVTRVDGKIVETLDIQGGPCHMNEARSFLEKFKARVDAKSERPWDVEHFHRDTAAAAEKAKNEGRVEDLRIIAEMLNKAMQGGPGSVREPVNA